MNRSTAPTSRLRILIADEDAAVRTQLALSLEADGHHVVGHGNLYDALAEASWQAFDLIFIDPHRGAGGGGGGGGNGSGHDDALTRLHAECPDARVVLTSSTSNLAADARDEHLPKPFSPAQAQAVARRVTELRLLERKLRALEWTLDDLDPHGDVPTASAAMARAVELARTAATSNAAVLIRGEIGTGKGRLARAIHCAGARAQAPFARVSCHTDSPDALGAELFGLSKPPSDDLRGRRREAAGSSPLALLDHCEGGTLVFDAVGELPIELQVKLLRLIREREYERHDDFRPRPANVRVIATTHVELGTLAQRGRFRGDLLSALETVHIDLPPLRHRGEDIPALARRFADRFARENHRPPCTISPQAMQVLCEHRWPGNVRELRNVIERAVLLCKSETIPLDALPPNLLNTPPTHAVGDLVPLQTIEQLHIRKVVDSMPTITAAAAVLGVHPGTVLRRLKKDSDAAGAAEATRAS